MQCKCAVGFEGSHGFKLEMKTTAIWLMPFLIEQISEMESSRKSIIHLGQTLLHPVNNTERFSTAKLWTESIFWELHFRSCCIFVFERYQRNLSRDHISSILNAFAFPRDGCKDIPTYRRKPYPCTDSKGGATKVQQNPLMTLVRHDIFHTNMTSQVIGCPLFCCLSPCLHVGKSKMVRKRQSLEVNRVRNSTQPFLQA